MLGRLSCRDQSLVIFIDGKYFKMPTSQMRGGLRTTTVKVFPILLLQLWLKDEISFAFSIPKYIHPLSNLSPRVSASSCPPNVSASPSTFSSSLPQLTLTNFPEFRCLSLGYWPYVVALLWVEEQLNRKKFEFREGQLAELTQLLNFVVV